MKKPILLILLFASLRLFAQEPLEVKRVSLDSLVSFLNREFPERYYSAGYSQEQATFSVSAPRESFREAAINALKDKGYRVSSYGSSYFILQGKTVFPDLPTGYFDDTGAGTDDGDLDRYLSEQNSVATFQNKVYEIGEPGARKSGTAYLSGHVKDVSSMKEGVVHLLGPFKPLVKTITFDNGTENAQQYISTCSLRVILSPYSH